MLDRLGFELSEGERAQCVAQFADVDGKVRGGALVEFVESLQEEGDADLTTNVRREVKRLKRDDRDWDRNLKHAFSRYDRDESGHVDRRDFKRGLEKLGFELADGDLARLLSRFDNTGDGRVAYRDFVQFVSARGGGPADDDDDLGRRPPQGRRPRRRAHAQGPAPRDPAAREGALLVGRPRRLRARSTSSTATGAARSTARSSGARSRTSGSSSRRPSSRP